MRDRLFWRWSKKGEYIVKPTYLHLQKMKLVSNTRTSRVMKFPRKKIWSTTVPNKLKHFAYRAATNTLSCKANLERRGVDVKIECPLCKQLESENVDNLFLHCNWSRVAWFSHPLNLNVDVV